MDKLKHQAGDVEWVIQSRASQRDGKQLETRQAEALELIADELTRLRAEARSIRYLLGGFVARSR
jgi:CHAD domain-containing protein